MNMNEQKSYDNLQDCFNDIYTRMIKQGKPSIETGSSPNVCKYRSVNGACAIGIILSDRNVELLDLMSTNLGITRFENLAVVPLSEGETAKKIVKILLPTTETSVAFDFLSDMQYCHDLAAVQSNAGVGSFIHLFKKAAREQAQRYELTVPEG